ncbi:hypothetical protein OY671_012897, partial [Metschnikowia pulcherrima]
MMPSGVLRATSAESRQNGTTVSLSSGRPQALDLDAWYWLGAREQRRFTDEAAFLRFVAEREMEHFPSSARSRPPRVVTTVAWLILVGIALAVAISFVPWSQTAQGGGQVTTSNAEDRARDVSSSVGG